MAPRKKRAPKAQAKKASTTKKATSKKAPAKKATAKKTTKKKAAAKKTTKRGRPKKVQEPEVADAPQEEVVEDQLEPSATGPLVVERPTQWILVKTMAFGLINERFPVGTVFTIDLDNRIFRCERNGMIY